MSAILTPVSPVPVRSRAEVDDPFLFRRIRTWWLLTALFLLAQENGLFTRQDDTYWSLKRQSEQYSSSPVLTLLTLALWLICSGLLLGYIRPTLRMMLKQKAILAFPVLALVSSCWSQVPMLTLRHSLLLFFLFAFAWFFAMFYSPRDQMRLLLAVGFIVALTSTAMALMLPQFGIASTGEWKGVFAQKNRLGLSVLFLFAGLPFWGTSSRRGRVEALVLASVPLSLILLSQSRTSLFLAATLTGLRILGPSILRTRREQLPFILFATLIGALMLFVSVPVVLSLLGRNPTLTGRTESWSLLLPFAFTHPLLGYGYQGFWTGDGDSLTIMRSRGAGMHGSDGGYVDMLLQFGIVGLGVMLTALVVSMRDFLNLLRYRPAPLTAFWYAGIVIAIFVGSITESGIPSQTGILTFVFVVACVGLRRLRDKERDFTPLDVA